MSEEKRNRLVVAATVNIVILIAVLAAVMIYQLIYIGVYKNRYDRMMAEYKYIEEQIKDKEDSLEYLQSEEYLWKLAHEQGWIFPNGKP